MWVASTDRDFFDLVNKTNKTFSVEIIENKNDSLYISHSLLTPRYPCIIRDEEGSSLRLWIDGQLDTSKWNSGSKWNAKVLAFMLNEAYSSKKLNGLKILSEVCGSFSGLLETPDKRLFAFRNEGGSLYVDENESLKLSTESSEGLELIEPNIVYEVIKLKELRQVVTF